MPDLLKPLRDSWKPGPIPSYAARHNSMVTALGDDFVQRLDSGVGERAIHAFLKKNPFLLMTGVLGGVVAVERVAVFPEVRLGDEYVADFALVSVDSDGARWTFIELESPQAPIFNKAGDPSKQLVHGLRQVDDWSHFIRHNLEYAKKRLMTLHKSAEIRGPRDMWRTPTFIVVLGRERSLTEKSRRLKTEMNDRDPRRQVVTYDRLNPTRWSDSDGPEGILDDDAERGYSNNKPWPTDPLEPDFKMRLPYLRALARSRKTGNPETVRFSRE